ncbi:MAG: NADH-quinone oxidoreductase subunit J [Anaerolineales bacterium]|nr:NADH-quinone oxidoreductase subunit J [Anaerolineales bacterium]MCB8992115.1 NADH-quinone oxidoreductase subunit J [Ardenticatenaceae bacterium]
MGAQIIFIIVSVFTIGAALIVVTNRNLFHAALALMASFLGVAGLYVLLEAGFMAAAQLLVYIGAISILIIFAIMMTRRLMQATEMPFNAQWGLGLFASILVLAVLVFVVGNYWPLQPDAVGFLQTTTPVNDEVIQTSITTLGQAFVEKDGYVLPFELASVLLLAALVGAILVAWPPSEENEA